MAFTLKFRSLSKTFDHIPETCLFPFIRVLGTEIAPEDTNSAAYAKWKTELVMRMGHPPNIAAIACGFKSFWPELPDEAVRYKLYELPDGRQEVDFRLAMDADEFLALIQPINNHVKEVETAKKPAEISDTIEMSNRERSALEEERRSLDARLVTRAELEERRRQIDAQLETASI